MEAVLDGILQLDVLLNHKVLFMDIARMLTDVVYFDDNF